MFSHIANMLTPRFNISFNNSNIRYPIMEQTAHYLDTILTEEEKALIEESIKNPQLRETMRSITNYQKTGVRASITKKVVDEFLNNGVKQFGTTVESFRIHVLEYLEHFVELRDENPQKCIMKVLWHCVQCAIHQVDPR